MQDDEDRSNTNRRPHMQSTGIDQMQLKQKNSSQAFTLRRNMLSYHLTHYSNIISQNQS